MINKSNKIINLGSKISLKTSETKKEGFYFMQKIKNNEKYINKNIIILLEGCVGSGKTIFAKGIGKNLNIKQNINSPTFVLSKIYKAKNRKLYHLDIYRYIASNIEDKKILSIIEELLETIEKNDIILIESCKDISNLVNFWNFKINFLFINDKARNISLKEKINY
ncbi:tRNA (adenosine(37)-N6)-threonylcarbamoyltransferase complex ATPase subunit type 1 TsaE [Texas Phoenix palm phytoplasma]|uniref:tRNA threonylcarbamoyladenosine biosynthesis protein TsaE n=1 Tax=Texas Phoenix palm phytoplasma TaxID=176709 RepID=A0ABS5BIT5_9MOLU|nr:tRNA (adenosine(37)-N6)-threonylcarbamoyltransferase complex ATPase subunit type 1 TsaE [Texas Phoenix palm phytoplasma]MBP3059482.1 tRNA (adenosine(37)-N6)-threonylcarbamoyltransferase complex ATPase subunit type 1 TsaE [Texas Phoenix palm phytoplasma]